MYERDMSKASLVGLWTERSEGIRVQARRGRPSVDPAEQSLAESPSNGKLVKDKVRRSPIDNVK